MDTTVVEFDPLPDTIRPPTEDDHFLPVCRASLTFASVRRIEIRGMGFKLCRAGVDSFIGHPSSTLAATGPLLPDRGRSGIDELCDTLV